MKPVKTYTTTILAVDDDPIERENIEEFLWNEGYRLLFARDGEEAIEKIAEVKPDLILLDVMMPRMNGFELCQIIRSDATTADIPIVMLTALHDQGSRIRGIEAGADDFLSKPYDGAELRARIGTIVRLNRYPRLIAERAKFEMVVNHSETGYLLLRDDDSILFANPKARLYLGIPEETEEISDAFLSLAQAQYHADPEVAWQQWPTALNSANDGMARYLIRPESETASAFWLRVDTLDYLPSESGMVWLVRLQDVTEQMLSGCYLWSVQRAIQHKMRTPLVGIGWVLEEVKLLAHLLPEDTAKRVDLALTSAQQMSDEIHGILTYAKIYDASSTKDWVALHELKSLCQSIHDKYSLSTLAITGLDELGDKEMMLSSNSLELIFREILENARKFHPSQNPEIQISISTDQREVTIQIQDDGQRLSPEQLAQIWYPYYQAEKFFTGNLPGMGLGLATVSLLVSKGGGKCQIYNRIDSTPGVVVKLIFPIFG